MGRSSADNSIQASCKMACWLECWLRFTYIIIYDNASRCRRCRIGQREKLAEHALIRMAREWNQVPVTLVLDTLCAFFLCSVGIGMEVKRRHQRHWQEHCQQQPRCDFPFQCLFHGGKDMQSLVKKQIFIWLFAIVPSRWWNRLPSITAVSVGLAEDKWKQTALWKSAPSTKIGAPFNAPMPFRIHLQGTIWLVAVPNFLPKNLVGIDYLPNFAPLFWESLSALRYRCGQWIDNNQWNKHL